MKKFSSIACPNNSEDTGAAAIVPIKFSVWCRQSGAYSHDPQAHEDGYNDLASHVDLKTPEEQDRHCGKQEISESGKGCN